MSLGSDIVTAINALSEADKRDMPKVWEAIGGEIETYPPGPQSSIFDNRDAGDVTPDGLPDKTIFFTFTDDIAGSPNTWDAVINVKGWTDTYAAWQLFSNSNVDDADKNLYFRRGRGATWDALQKIWTDQNDGAASGLNADKLDGYHEGSFFRLSQNEIVTGRPAFNGGITGTSSPFTVDSTFRVPNLNADFVDGIHGGSFIRSDANDDVSAHTEWQDGKEVRLGTDADFRMLFSGSSTFFKGYYHGASLFFQGEDLGGDNRNMLVLDPDTGPILYYNGSERFAATTDGAKVTGKLELTAAGSKFYSPVGGEDSGGTWHPITNPTVGIFASKTVGWTADRFTQASGGWELDFSALVPAGTKAIKVHLQAASTSSHIVMARKKGDPNISNTPVAATEWSTLIATIPASGLYWGAQVTLWLSNDYKVEIAVSHANVDIILISYPRAYMI